MNDTNLFYVHVSIDSPDVGGLSGYQECASNCLGLGHSDGQTAIFYLKRAAGPIVSALLMAHMDAGKVSLIEFMSDDEAEDTIAMWRDAA